MAKPPKTPKPKAQTPKGFEDTFGEQLKARNDMLACITEVYHHYGFDPLETSAIETVEALGKFLPDVDRPMGGVFAFQDEDESWLALRYDLTAPLARVAAQYKQDLPTPYRRYAYGPVWRNEKPGVGRFRQFYQCDADTVGAASVAADAEMCMMLADALQKTGISANDFQVRVNNRKILTGVLEVINLQDDEQRMVVLRAIDKLDRLGTEGVEQLLGEGRKDPSGDFTKGAGLSAQQIAVVLGFVTAKRQNTQDTCNVLKDLVSGSPTGLEGVEELLQMAELFDAARYANAISIDPSVVRGLAYYTGPVYEAELTFEVLDEKGQPRQFGSVAGGGRYDDLVKRFTGQAVPATGVSIGVDRLLSALALKKGETNAQSYNGPVVICAMDRNRMADYQAMCTELRQAGIRAEVFLGGGNMAKQLKYADKRHSPVAIIEGQDEKDAGVVQLKDLALGAQLAQNITSNEEWKQQPAQKTVRRVDLISEVKSILKSKA
jgi:histidyl-tRNA synthetase